MSLHFDHVTVSGITSPVLEAGPHSKEAVVFVHGNPGSLEDFAPLVEKTGAFARAIALDMPGFGRADRPRDFRYTVEGYGAHLGGALQALGVERAHLVLHDFGGPWGLDWASRNPGALASVVLIDTGVLINYRWHRMARLWRTPVLAELVMMLGNKEKMEQGLNATNPKPLPKEFVARMMRGMDAGTRRAILKLYRATGDLDGLARRLQAALRPLDRNALVIWGKHDAYIPPEQAERQKLTFPRAEVHVLESAGHWPFVDEPARVEALVLDFLKRNVGAVPEPHAATAA